MKICCHFKSSQENQIDPRMLNCEFIRTPDNSYFRDDRRHGHRIHACHGGVIHRTVPFSHPAGGGVTLGVVQETTEGGEETCI